MGWKRAKEEVPLAVSEVPREIKVEEKETVVTELPTVQVRKVRGEDGAVHNLTTLTEAIQEIREAVKELLKRTAD